MIRTRRTRRTRLPLPRNVVVLSWVSFFQDAASEMLYPVMPLFITGVLGAPPAVLGLIEGVAEGTASITKAFSGRLADRLHRHRLLIAVGYGASAVSKPVIGLATGWPLVLVARFTDRLGKGVRNPPRDALIASDTPVAIRGRAFGFHRAADTAGAVVGPLLGLALYEALNHQLRPLFFVAFVPAAISVGLIAFVRERRRRRLPRNRPAVKWRSLPRPFWKVVAFLTVFALFNFSDALLILRAKDLGLSFVSIVLVYVLYNLSYAALSYPAGVVSDRLPRRYVFGVGLVVFGLAYTGLGLVTNPAWVWVLLPLYGAYTALTDGVSRAWVADLLPARRLGSGLGVYQALGGGGVLVAGIWAGLAWGSDGRLPLLISGVAVGVLALGLFVTPIVAAGWPRRGPARRSRTPARSGSRSPARG